MEERTRRGRGTGGVVMRVADAALSWRGGEWGRGRPGRAGEWGRRRRDSEGARVLEICPRGQS